MDGAKQVAGLAVFEPLREAYVAAAGGAPAAPAAAADTATVAQTAAAAATAPEAVAAASGRAGRAAGGPSTPGSGAAAATAAAAQPGITGRPASQPSTPAADPPGHRASVGSGAAVESNGASASRGAAASEAAAAIAAPVVENFVETDAAQRFVPLDGVTAVTASAVPEALVASAPPAGLRTSGDAPRHAGPLAAFPSAAASNSAAATAPAVRAAVAQPARSGACPPSDASGVLHVNKDAPRRADLGIRMVWVAPSARRQRFASRLLDAARCQLSPGYVAPRSRVAFSQPTAAGAALARAYVGTDAFLVYGV